LKLNSNNEYLYSAGKEGVIVIWNLKTDKNSFLPRLSAEIRKIAISPNNQFLALTCSENSIKIINLFNNTISNEISSVKLNPKDDLEITCKKFKNKKTEYLFTFNSLTGKIYSINSNNGHISGWKNLFSKNFFSQTEKETINNKNLKFVEFDIKSNFLISYDELYDHGYLLSYLRLWKCSDFSTFSDLELVSICENPHSNYKISQIKILKQNEGKLFSFITCSETNFKLWECEKESFSSTFTGNYRNHPVTSIAYDENKEKIYSLLNGSTLVEWSREKKQISNVYIFKENDLKNIAIIGGTDYLIFYNNKLLICFSLSEWAISFSERFEISQIYKIELDKEGVLVLYLKNTQDEENGKFLIYHLNINLRKYERCFLIENPNIKFMTLSKANTYFIITRNNDFYVMKKKQNVENKFLGKKLKSHVSLEFKRENNLQTGMELKFHTESIDSFKVQRVLQKETEDIFETALDKIKIKK
jgi:hypothetical protein